jgi:hypothetical protein
MDKNTDRNDKDVFINHFGACVVRDGIGPDSRYYNYLAAKLTTLPSCSEANSK